jgi:hypothetical protein
MKRTQAEKIGLFGRRVYFGDLVAEKTTDDFPLPQDKIDARQKELDKEYAEKQATYEKEKADWDKDAYAASKKNEDFTRIPPTPPLKMTAITYDAKAYSAYLLSVKRNEYIQIREPGNDEITAVNGLPKDHYLGAPDELKIERFKEWDVRNKEVEKAIPELALKCITGSSLVEDDDKPTPIDKVAAYVRSHARIYARVLREFVELAQGFQNESVEK